MIYGYARVSTLEQVEGTSLETQERRVRATALYLGEELDRMFVDAGVSGSMPLDQRTAGGSLICAVKSGDTVIASKLDRMFRSAADALNTLTWFRENGVKLILCDMGMEPVTENGVAKLMFSVLAAMAEFERERIRERTVDGKKAKRASGGHIGGKPGFGYMVIGSGKNSRIVADPALARALNELRRCWMAGTSLRGAVKYLSSNCGVRVSFNQVHRAYEKFEHDCAEAGKWDVAHDSSENVRGQKSIS